MKTIKIGDNIQAQLFPEKYIEGKILDIDKNMIDPRMVYKVCFDELNIITFFDENTILSWIEKYNKDIIN